MNEDRFLEILARSVAGGSTVRDATKLAQCSEATGYRLSSSIEFKQRVSELRTMATDQAVGALANLAVKAVDALEKVLDDPVSKPSERIAAAKAILSLLSPISELGELRGRLDAIERQAVAA